MTGSADDAAGFIFQRGRQHRPRRLHRRRKREENRGDERGCECERDHAHIGNRRQRPRGLGERQRLHQERTRPPRERETEHTTGRREQQALDETLTDDCAAARTERNPDRDFLLPRGAAREQQVRDVGARDQQHHADHAHQHQNGRGEFSAQIRSPFRTLAQKQMFRHEALAERFRRGGRLFDLLFVDLPVDHVHRRFSLLARDARLDARHDGQPPAAAVLQIVPGRRHLRFHHHRHHHVRVLADDDAVEAWRRDADDGHRRAVEGDGTIDDRRIAGEAAHPVVVTQDRHRISARRLVVVWRQRAADVRADGEDVEVVPGHELTADALRLSVGHQRERRGKACDDAAEHRRLIAEVAVHRVREGAVVERASLKCAGSVEDHELLRISYGQQAEQQLIGERENRRVRADAERDRQDHDERERRRLQERASRVANVLRQMGHGYRLSPTRRALSTKVFVVCRGN